LGIIGALTVLSLTVLSLTALASPANAAISGTSMQPVTHTAQVSGATGPARGKHLIRPPKSPDIPGGSGSSSTSTSTNWDGYTVLNSSSTNTNSFNRVSAQWVEPTITCDPNNPNPEWVGFWVGFDGWLNGSVEQGGTQAMCFNGVPSYSVWWEMFPFNFIQTGFSINPGDVIQASVTFNTSTSQFEILVMDVTSNQTLTQDIACQSGQANCARSSADVISEDIGGGSDLDGLYFLPNYGTATYTNASATDVNGHTGSLNDPTWNSVGITEVSSANVTKQTVGPLSTDGKSFNTTWQHEAGTATLPSASIVANYIASITAPSTNTIGNQIEVANTGAFAVPLSSLTIRYWFTEDGTNPLSYSCDWAPIGCSNITGTFVTVSPSRTSADRYLQIGFTAGAGSLGVGGNTGGIQSRINQTTWVNMTQTNDYSFNAADSTFTANPNITVYFNGTLIYGTEP
jgi:hypothetical protein